MDQPTKQAVRPVRRDDWATEPFPEASVTLAMDAPYDAEEFARIRLGSLPREMEDKWFLFYEEPWLHMYRSWTKFEVFQVRFVAEGEGARAVEVCVNRDPEQYSGKPDEMEPDVAEWVINLLLAFHPVAPPVPDGAEMEFWSNAGRAVMGHGPAPGVPVGEPEA